MDPQRPSEMLTTHDVENQPGPRPVRDLWLSDIMVQDWLHLNLGDAAAAAEYGAALGDVRMVEAGRLANRYPPEARIFDTGGRRLDEVEFHPAYHAQLEAGIHAGYAARAWEEAPGGHVAHAAMVYMLSQVDPGVCCPLTMTYAGIPALRDHSEITDQWAQKLMSRMYDPRILPIDAKDGATLGMAMTEKQGGSDVRANTTRARALGDGYRLTGHKWFCSAPMSDGFLTLAQAPDGLTCFLVPRWLEDGSRNTIQLMRLKDKLGNRSNASAEIEFHGAWAWEVGDPGQGVRTIIDMVHHTRLDTALAPAGLMRAAAVQALWWADGRGAFQRRLIDQPLMGAVLADLAIETEAALGLGLRIAAAFDGRSTEDRGLARIGVALAKYLSNKRCPQAIYEAMEVMGGMGYVEDTSLPMLYREAPLNSIWEGSGNVICLDILRTLDRDEAARTALEDMLSDVAGSDPVYDAALARHQARWPALPEEAEARWFSESLATLLTAAVLLEGPNDAVAAAYLATRVAGDRGHTLGAHSLGVTQPLIDRLR